jgi:hypothetical protein
MKTAKYLSVLAVVAFGLAVSTALAAPPQQTAVPKTLAVSMPAAGVATPISTCMVSGQVKLDPADSTNGFLHYKGAITFKATVALEGVDLYLEGPKYSCTCVTCPQGSSYATGLQPAGKFAAGEAKSFNADCGSFPINNLVSGPWGKGKIQFFVKTQGEGGIFKWANCSGTFSFTR